jgi:hypothetical protein
MILDIHLISFGSPMVDWRFFALIVAPKDLKPVSSLFA